MELGGGVKDDLFELLELGEDLRLDLVVVVNSLVGIELLGEIGDRSPEIVPLLLELEGNDFPSVGGGFLDRSLVKASLQFNTLTNILDTITESTCSHCKGALSCNSP